MKQGADRFRDGGMNARATVQPSGRTTVSNPGVQRAPQNVVVRQEFGTPGVVRIHADGTANDAANPVERGRGVPSRLGGDGGRSNVGGVTSGHGSVSDRDKTSKVRSSAPGATSSVGRNANGAVVASAPSRAPLTK